MVSITEEEEKAYGDCPPVEEDEKMRGNCPPPEELEIQQDIIDAVELMAGGKDECSHAEAVLEQANRIVASHNALKDELKHSQEALSTSKNLLAIANTNVEKLTTEVKELIEDVNDLVEVTDEYVEGNVKIRMQANYATGIAIGAVVVSCVCILATAIAIGKLF